MAPIITEIAYILITSIKIRDGKWSNIPHQNSDKPVRKQIPTPMALISPDPNVITFSCAQYIFKHGYKNNNKHMYVLVRIVCSN